MSDDVLFEELSDDVNPAEAGAECGEVPSELIQLSVDLEPTGMTPADFKILFSNPPQPEPEKPGKDKPKKPKK